MLNVKMLKKIHAIGGSSYRGLGHELSSCLVGTAWSSLATFLQCRVDTLELLLSGCV